MAKSLQVVVDVSDRFGCPHRRVPREGTIGPAFVTCEHPAAKESIGVCETYENHRTFRLTKGFPKDCPLISQNDPRADESDKVRSVLEALTEEFEASIRHHESKGQGGQHVTFTGDFASVGPGTLARMRRWLRDMKEALDVENLEQ